MADTSKTKHIISAFREPQPGKREERWLSPPQYHYLPWVCGGLGQLYKRQSKSTLQGNISSCVTDKDGCFSPNETAPLMAKRYQFIKEIGRGGSAVVVKARDTFKRGDSFVAVKILNTGFFDLGYQESVCIRRLNQADPGGFSGAIRLQNTFHFEGHFCMVYEILQPAPLHHFFRHLEQEEKLPFIRKVAIKLLQLLGFLQSQNVIHADLKPENILCDSNGLNGKIKVIDFGNAIQCVYDELALYYDDFELQTITYRAPEVICGLPFGPEVDLWSVGCILAELYVGRPLFFAKDKEGILGKIYQLLGPLPVNIYQRGKFYHSFDHLGGPPQPYIETFNRLRGVLGNSCCADMVSFILGFLNYDAGKRMTVREAIQHPFLAPEVAFGFFIPSESGPCYPGGISISSTGYTHAPKMDKDLKAKKMESVQLLRRGTISKITPERSARAIAQVSPFSRPSMIAEEKKGSAAIVSDIPRILLKDKTKEQVCLRNDGPRKVREKELVPGHVVDRGIERHELNLDLTSEADGIEPAKYVTAIDSRSEQPSNSVTVKTSSMEESGKKVEEIFSKNEKGHRTKLTVEVVDVVQGERRKKKKQDFGTRRKRKTSLKEDRDEMEVVGRIDFIDDNYNSNRREGLQGKLDVKGHDQKRFKDVVPSLHGEQDSSSKGGITFQSKSQQDGLEGRGVAGGIERHSLGKTEEDVVQINFLQNDWKEVVGLTLDKNEGECKTDVRWSGGKLDGKIERVDGMKGKIVKGTAGEADGTTFFLGETGGKKELDTMKMQQPVAGMNQDSEKRKQKAGSHGKRRGSLNLEGREDGKGRRSPPSRKCSSGKKRSSEEDISSLSSRKRQAWQVYKQFEEEELASPQKRRKSKSFARQLQFEDGGKMNRDESKEGRVYKLRKVNALMQDLEKFLEETNGKPLHSSRRSDVGVSSPCSLYEPVECGIDRRKKKSGKSADEMVAQKGSQQRRVGKGGVRKARGSSVVGNAHVEVPGGSPLEGRRTSSNKKSCTKGNRSRKHSGDKIDKKNGVEAKRGKNSPRGGDVSVKISKGSVSKVVCETNQEDLNKERNCKGRGKKKLDQTELHPTNQKYFGKEAKKVRSKRSRSKLSEEGDSELKSDDKEKVPPSNNILEKEETDDDMIDSDREEMERKSTGKNYEGNEVKRGQQTQGDSDSFDSILQITPGRQKTLRESATKKEQRRNRSSPEHQRTCRGQQIKQSPLEDEEAEEEDDMVLLL